MDEPVWISAVVEPLMVESLMVTPMVLAPASEIPTPLPVKVLSAIDEPEDKVAVLGILKPFVALLLAVTPLIVRRMVEVSVREIPAPLEEELYEPLVMVTAPLTLFRRRLLLPPPVTVLFVKVTDEPLAKPLIETPPVIVLLEIWLLVMVAKGELLEILRGAEPLPVMVLLEIFKLDSEAAASTIKLIPLEQLLMVFPVMVMAEPLFTPIKLIHAVLPEEPLKVLLVTEIPPAAGEFTTPLVNVALLTLTPETSLFKLTEALENVILDIVTLLDTAAKPLQFWTVKPENDEPLEPASK